MLTPLVWFSVYANCKSWSKGNLQAKLLQNLAASIQAVHKHMQTLHSQIDIYVSD